jgi:hypothetical protein
MFNWFKKSKIEFYSLVPGLEKVYPIQPASSYRPAWTKVAAADFRAKNEKQTSNAKTILKCPGIMNLFSAGYILYNYCDIVVKSNASTAEMSWEYDWEQKKHYPENITFPYLAHHEQDVLTKYMAPPHGANPIMLKINTPWRVKAPDDVVFLEIPLLYPDDNRFMTAGGILDPKETRQINPAFWWFGDNKEPQLLKAGTPLVQYIPIKREFVKKYEADVREASSEEVKLERQFNMIVALQRNTNVKTRQDNTDKIYGDK